MARSVMLRSWPWRWRLPCFSCLCMGHVNECACRKLDDAFHRTEHSGVSIPSSTLPSWLPASFSFGIFSFSLKPPSLPLPVFFFDATLMVASSSVQVTWISQVSFVLRRGCIATLTFPILSHGDFLGLAPLRSGSEYHSFRQRCVVFLIGTGGFWEGSSSGQPRGSIGPSRKLGLVPVSPDSRGITAESKWPQGARITRRLPMWW